MYPRQECVLTNKDKIFIRLLIWLSAEILLSYLGLDDLADYSEFLMSKAISPVHQIEHLA
ncbi:MAG: hypothetical protein AAGD09_06265 [Cyanobacteria bacterium P01_F01_bin.56]